MKNTAIRGLIHTGFDQDSADLPALYDTILYLLNYRNQVEDKILRIGSLASMDRFTEAQTANNSLGATTTEESTFKVYMANILSASTDISALPDSVYQTALLSLSLENVSARGMAEILQHFREGIYHPLVALNPEAEEEERPSSGIKEDAQTLLGLGIKVTPNPFNHEIRFDLSELREERYTLTVTDLLGRTMWSRQLNGGQVLVWSTAQVPEGHYLYHVRGEKNFLQSGKLLKIKR